MMGLRDFGASLPPGFRFYPSDEELVCHYLHNKISNDQQLLKGSLLDIDLHKCEPWQLPEVTKMNVNEWYFFNFRDRKYATGNRTNRATISGYWKATGKDKPVQNSKTFATVGMRKTLVFYRNRAPNGVKTDWIMHEFRLENPHLPPKEDWVLCKVFLKNKGENRNISECNDLKFEKNMLGKTSVVTSPCYRPLSHGQYDQPFTSYHSSISWSNPQLQTQTTDTFLSMSKVNPSGLDFHVSDDQMINVDEVCFKSNNAFQFLLDGCLGEVTGDEI